MACEAQHLPEKLRSAKLLHGVQALEDEGTSLEIYRGRIAPAQPLEVPNRPESVVTERLGRIQREAFRKHSSVARNAILDIADRKNLSRGELYEVSETLVAVIQQCPAELADIARSAIVKILSSNSQFLDDLRTISSQIYQHLDRRDPANADLLDAIGSISR